ncbi:MAG: aldo/keto reductase [Planctomycetes bacterium]|nr:aldo/keto reductase [Planctomycetota bacterium]
MEYRRLGRAGVKVSPLCLGTMMFGGPTSELDSIAMMHRAIESGINFLDTANMYSLGQSELVVGKAIADRRERVVLATKGRQKMGDGPNDKGASRLHLMRELDHSLRRLGTDHVDLYYVHAPDDETPFEETMRTLDDMVRAGKVRYLGCSNYRTWQVCESMGICERRGLYPFVCVQPLYNLVNRDIEVELFPYCRAAGLGVVSYSPLARGILTGKYGAGQSIPAGSRMARNDARMKQAEWRTSSLDVARAVAERARDKGVTPSQFALAWCLANPNLTAVILGPRTMEQLDDNVRALEVKITAEDEALIDSLVPPGEHSGKGFQDTAYPITGRR